MYLPVKKDHNEASYCVFLILQSEQCKVRKTNEASSTTDWPHFGFFILFGCWPVGHSVCYIAVTPRQLCHHCLVAEKMWGLITSTCCQKSKYEY